MMKFCSYENCTYRLCKKHIRNKPDTKEQIKYELVDFKYCEGCKLKPLQQFKRKRDEK